MPGFQTSSTNIDLSQRFQYTQTVQGSPIAAAAETVIATLTLTNFGALTVQQGVSLSGWAAYTVGTNGTAATLRLRQTAVGGTLVLSSGALTKTAANLYVDDIAQTDTSPPTGGVYVLTLQITGGTANTTISAVYLSAQIV